jgi:hypothetical protein
MPLRACYVCARQRVFIARVCSLYTPLVSLAHQREHGDSRACPCERVFNNQVCVFPRRTHLYLQYRVVRVLSLEIHTSGSNSTSKAAQR